MTRETRVAMLVGLLFIVMFGLVLSELTGHSPPPVSLSARDDQTAAEQYAPVLRVERPQEPAGLAELVARRSDPPPPTGIALGDPCSIVEVRVVRRSVEEDPSSGRQPPVAEGRGPAPPDPGPAPPPEPRPASYTVKAGDSPIRIARTVYGPQHQREYPRILQANGIRDPRTLQVGQVLTIPPLPGAPPPRGEPAGAALAGRDRPAPAPGREGDARYREMDLEELRRSFLPSGARVAPGPSGPAPSGPSPASASPPGRRYYVVQKGDTLAKIAREMLEDGTPSSVRKLYSANKDRLNLGDPDHLPVGVKLEIPS